VEYLLNTNKSTSHKNIILNYICYGVGGTRGAARRLAEERDESRDSFTCPAGETITRVFKFSSFLSSFSSLFSCSLYIIVYI
jgi:hypothetical protein